MRVLRIFDASSYAHAGRFIKQAIIEGPVYNRGDKWSRYEIHAGGASFLFNHINMYHNTCDLIVCADRRPTIKTNMWGRYKESREYNPDVAKHKKLIEMICESCGITTLYDDGYEADDFIYSCVQRFKNEYDHIYIHTADSDMYFLVDNNVSIAKTHKNTKVVNMDNYEYTVDSKEKVAYNTETFWKILWGDTSDNIPALDEDLAIKMRTYFCQPYLLKKLGDKQFMIDVCSDVFPQALSQVQLVFPLDTRVPQEISRPESEMIIEWGLRMQNKTFSNYDLKKSDAAKAVIDEMIRLKLYDERN